MTFDLRCNELLYAVGMYLSISGIVIRATHPEDGTQSLYWLGFFSQWLLIYLSLYTGKMLYFMATTRKIMVEALGRELASLRKDVDDLSPAA